jgi:hypothetical protein
MTYAIPFLQLYSVSGHEFERTVTGDKAWVYNQSETKHTNMKWKCTSSLRPNTFNIVRSNSTVTAIPANIHIFIGEAKEMVKHSHNFNCDNRLKLIKTGSPPFFQTLFLKTGHLSIDQEEHMPKNQ